MLWLPSALSSQTSRGVGGDVEGVYEAHVAPAED